MKPINHGLVRTATRARPPIAGRESDPSSEVPISAADLDDQDEIDALCGFLDGLAGTRSEPAIPGDPYAGGRAAGAAARRDAAAPRDPDAEPSGR